jgi:hypothetical protein
VDRQLDDAVADLIRHHYGIISRRQAMALGMTRHQVQHRLAVGEWVVVAPTVYRHRAVAGSWSGEVLAHCLSADGLASHRSAAVLWDLDLIRRGTPEIIVPRGRHLRREGVIIHESTQFDRVDLVLRQGIPTTGIERTLLDLAAVVSDTTALAAVDSARRKGLTSWAALDQALGRHARRGRDGTQRLRRVLLRLTGESPAALSGWSWQVAQLLQAHNLPEPVLEHVVRDAAGRFVAQVDLAYPAVRLAMELDSITFHDNARSFVADRRRWNELSALGWTPLAFTYADFRYRPAEMVERVAEVYRRLSSRSRPFLP